MRVLEWSCGYFADSANVWFSFISIHVPGSRSAKQKVPQLWGGSLRKKFFEFEVPASPPGAGACPRKGPVAFRHPNLSQFLHRQIDIAKRRSRPTKFQTLDLCRPTIPEWSITHTDSNPRPIKMSTGVGSKGKDSNFYSPQGKKQGGVTPTSLSPVDFESPVQGLLEKFSPRIALISCLSVIGTCIRPLSLISVLFIF